MPFPAVLSGRDGEGMLNIDRQEPVGSVRTEPDKLRLCLSVILAGTQACLAGKVYVLFSLGDEVRAGPL